MQYHFQNYLNLHSDLPMFHRGLLKAITLAISSLLPAPQLDVSARKKMISIRCLYRPTLNRGTPRHGAAIIYSSG